MPSAVNIRQRLAQSRFFKGEAAVAGPVTLTQRRIFILPTKRGLGLILTILLLLLIAYVYNNNLIYFLGFLLSSIFFITILHTYKVLSGLQVQAGNVQAVFAGEDAGFQIIVSHSRPQTRRAITARLETEIIFDLSANDSRTLTLYKRAKRRGWQQLETVTFSSDYPLGIFRAWSPIRFDRKVLVYPKPSQLELPLPTENFMPESGAINYARNQQGDFDGVRAYQAGDAVRQIHWKAYAKGQGLVSKQYADQTGKLEVWLDYASAPGTHFEECLSVLTRWVIDAEKCGIKYGLILPGVSISPESGQQHFTACLEALALC